MENVIFATNLHFIGLLVASVCLTACIAAILSMRDAH